MSAFLEVRDITVNHGPVRALTRVSLAVEAGEIVAVLGANGAGKSTLLRTISGLIRPQSGEILLEGRRLTGLPADQVARIGIAHVPEGRRIFPGLSVRENLLVAAPGRRDRGGESRDLSRVERLFPALTPRMRQGGWSLSGGEQQMLAIGRGLMARPKLLLLDEPSLGLAPMLVRQMLSAVRRIRAEGTPILLVEQNARAALRIADRAYVLRRGLVAFEGRASDLAARDDIHRAYLGA